PRRFQLLGRFSPCLIHDPRIGRHDSRRRVPELAALGGQRWFDGAARGGELGLSAGTSATMLGAQVTQPCRQGAQEGRLMCGPGGSDLPRSEPWASRASLSALGGPLAEAAAPGGSLCPVSPIRTAVTESCSV